MKINLWPSGEVLEGNSDESLLQLLKKQGFALKSSCGGCASCADCVIQIKTGEDHLNSQSFEELRLLGNVFHITKERLACQTKISGDITIDISKHPNLGANSSKKSTTKTMRRTKKDILAESLKEPSQTEPIQDKNLDKGGRRRPRPFSFSNEDQNK